MASIYLIRHGQASFGTDDYDRLSELGCRQAVVLGEYFESRGLTFDAVYSGNLQRQRKTAELAAGNHGTEHRVDPRFNEIDNESQLDAFIPVLLAERPEWQAWADKAHTSSKDYQKILEQVFNYWVSLGDKSPEGVQSWASYSGDVQAALAEVIREQGPGKNTAIFTSGGTIATIVAHVLGAGDAAYQFYEPVINCSVTQLLYNANKVSLSYYNDHSFLDLLGRQRGEALISYR